MVYCKELWEQKGTEMNPAKCDALDYIPFLVAAQQSFTCREAARCQAEEPARPSHDAFTSLLQSEPPAPAALCQGNGPGHPPLKWQT